MAGVDLFFERTPAAGPPWELLFGELSGPAPARTLEFAGSFSELQFTGRARSIVPCTASVTFPEMTMQSTALYQSKTQRPTVARVIATWEKGALGEFGVDGPHRVAVRSALGTQDKWTAGDRRLLTTSASQFSAVKTDTSTASWFDGAMSRHPDSNSLVFQSADHGARPNLQSAYQVAVRLGAARARASKAPSLLRGLLFSDQNRAFTPGYTQRGTKFYRYYINTDAIKLGKTGCEIQRLPAGEIETVVVEKLRHVLRSPEVLAHAVREVADLRPKIKESESIRALQSIDPVWDELFPSEQAGIVRTLIDRITVRRDGITIQWKDQGMNKLLRETLTAPATETA